MQETQKLFHCFARMAAEAGHAKSASTLARMESMHFFHVPWASLRVAASPQVPFRSKFPVVGASRCAPRYRAPDWMQVRPKGLCLMALFH